MHHLQDMRKAGLFHDIKRTQTANLTYTINTANYLRTVVYRKHEGCLCSKLAGYEQRHKLLWELYECKAKLGLCLFCVREGVCPHHSATGLSAI